MSKFRKLIPLAALSLIGSFAMAETYPSREVSTVIQWSAGGATDIAVRGMLSHVEAELGKKIVAQNKPGGAGVIGANFVLQQPADGYTLLGGAEGNALLKVMGLADFDVLDFYPVNIIAQGNVLVVANKDKPWRDFKDLLADVQANPGKVRMYTAGMASMPFTGHAMVSSVTRFPVNAVPFDGDGAGIPAILGGHVDFTFVAASSVQEHLKAGRLKALAYLGSESYQGIPPITDVLPDMKKYLPWGPFYGIFLKKGAPEEAKQKLIEAFRKGVANAEYHVLMEGRSNTVLNISGDEAEQYLKRWQSVTAWVYHDAGVAKKDPAGLGIPKP